MRNDVMGINLIKEYGYNSLFEMEAEIRRLMKSSPKQKDYVELTIQGSSLKHVRTATRKKRPKRAIAIGFPDDFPHENDYPDEAAYEAAVEKWEAEKSTVKCAKAVESDAKAELARARRAVGMHAAY